MKRLALVSVLLVLIAVAAVAQQATSPFEPKAKTAEVQEPTTNIEFGFGAYVEKDHEAEARAAWDAFCQSINTTGSPTIKHIGARGGYKGFSGTCSLSLTNAQFSTLLDAVRVLAAAPCFSRVGISIRIIP